MAIPIVPRIRRGRLYFPVAYALSSTVPLTLATAAEVHRPDMAELIDGGIATAELIPADGGVE